MVLWLSFPATQQKGSWFQLQLVLSDWDLYVLRVLVSVSSGYSNSEKKVEALTYIELK